MLPKLALPGCRLPAGGNKNEAAEEVEFEVGFEFEFGSESGLELEFRFGTELEFEVEFAFEAGTELALEFEFESWREFSSADAPAWATSKTVFLPSKPSGQT